MGWISPVFKVAAEIKSYFALLAFLAAIVSVAIQLTERGRRRSIVDRIGGRGVISERTLVKIAGRYKDDKERTKIIKEMLQHELLMTEASLDKMASDISGQSAILRSFAQAKWVSVSVALIALAFAIAGLVYEKVARPPTATPGAASPRPPTATPGAASPQALSQLSSDTKKLQGEGPRAPSVPGGALSASPPKSIPARPSAAGSSATGSGVTTRKQQPSPPVPAYAAPQAKAPPYPFKRMSEKGETAKIFLSRDIVMRLQLVNQNELDEGIPFTPYYISIDRLPVLALRLYKNSHDEVRTRIPDGLSDGSPLKGIWRDDANGIAKMLCVRLPTTYEWANAVVGSVIKPGRDSELVQGDAKGLIKIEAGGDLDNLRLNTHGIKINAEEWLEELALQQRLGPAPAFLRVVADRGAAFNKCE
jgi:hypothetical protein